MIRQLCVMAACASALATGIARADTTPSTPPDAPAHSLFDPTPDSALRGLCTDRPTKSTGPCTVDAGHWQVEVDAYDVTWDRSGDHVAGVITIPRVCIRSVRKLA